MIITSTPEDFQETKIYKLLDSKSKPIDGLIDKVTCFIVATRPLQELIISGPFKDYTLHNPNHSKKLMHLAEFVIPEATFDSLSPLELSILIMAFYLHDLGMVVTQTERERIIRSSEFQEFIQIRTDYYEKIQNIRQQIKTSIDEELLSLEASQYQITEAALAEFLRPLHATKARYVDLIKIIKESAGRNDIFSMNGVSFENELIEICISHNLNSSALIESNGVHKERFPREQVLGNYSLNNQYCAAILRIVDILDFDKERTPKSLFNSLGIQNKRLPGFEISLREWNKHLAIHTVSINAHEIVVSGDSHHPTTEHSINEFCRIIESEIRETQTIIRQNSTEINNKYQLCLPFIVRPDIRSINYVYKDYSIKLNESAIVNLLMGENLYIDSQVALRELIQNSIDACKLRLEIDTYIPQIKISLFCDSDNRSWLKIIDNGIGMDEYVLTNYFFKVGNSYYNSSDFKKFSNSKHIRNFTPISRFGIGLLSVFMIGEVIKVKTKNTYSPRLDVKERTLLIDGTDSLAVVTENESGDQGTTIEVLLRKGHDDEAYFKKLYGYIKDNIIRPQIPIELIDNNSNVIKIVPDNYIRLKSKIQNTLDKSNIQIVQIDFSRFSNILKGKGIFIFFKNEDGTLTYYDRTKKFTWGIYPLKETYLFENFLGGSRITVNGIQMTLKKIGSLYNLGKKYTAAVLDIEVKGIKEIEYDVSRDRVFGKGLNIIRREIFSSVEKGFVELGIKSILDSETQQHFALSVSRKTPSEPLDKDLIEKIKEFFPANVKWDQGIHKEIGEKLNISNSKVSRYITAMLMLKIIKKT
jgi:Molecular chaperone, HSP90 family